jgi:hypothetical protein
MDMYTKCLMPLLLVAASSSPTALASLYIDPNAPNIPNDGICSLDEAWTYRPCLPPVICPAYIADCGPSSLPEPRPLEVVLGVGTYRTTLMWSPSHALKREIHLTGQGRGLTIIEPAFDSDRLRSGITIGPRHWSSPWVTGGVLRVSGVTISGRGQAFLAGIHVRSGRLAISDSEIRNFGTASSVNGAALFAGFDGATEIEIDRSTVRDNVSFYAAIAIGPEAVFRMENSAVTGNVAGLGRTDFDSFPGGLLIFGAPRPANSRIVNSTISGNSGGIAGGIAAFSGPLEIRNTTITENSAHLFDPNISIAGGLLGDSEMVIANTLIIGNLPNDCSRSDSAGYNLLGSASNCVHPDLGDVFIEPAMLRAVLEPLEDYGGPTPTHALPIGSPAVDGGDPVGCLDPDGDELLFDQRGSLRPVDGNGDGGRRCDIGSFELLPTVEGGMEDLLTLLEALQLDRGIVHDLHGKASVAARASSDANPGNDVAAANSLRALIRAVEAQRGKKIPEVEAAALLATAENLIRLLEM